MFLLNILKKKDVLLKITYGFGGRSESLALAYGDLKTLPLSGYDICVKKININNKKIKNLYLCIFLNFFVFLWGRVINK